MKEYIGKIAPIVIVAVAFGIYKIHSDRKKLEERLHDNFYHGVMQKMQPLTQPIYVELDSDAIRERELMRNIEVHTENVPGYTGDE